MIGLSVDVHSFVEMQEGGRQFAVLVDWRPGPNKGLILQHPLFDKLLDDQQTSRTLPDLSYLHQTTCPTPRPSDENYIDPLATDPQGEGVRQTLAGRNGAGQHSRRQYRLDGDRAGIVRRRDRPHARRGCRQTLFSSGLVGCRMIAILSTVLWAFVVRVLREPSRTQSRSAVAGEELRP